MQKDDIKAVWDRYRSGQASEADKALLESWYADYEQPDLAELSEGEVAARVEAVRKSLPLEENTARQASLRRLWPRIAAAASLLLFLSAGAYFLLQKTQPPQTVAYKNDIPPGHNQATLTLANGQRIVLSKGLSGKLAQQGNTLIGIDPQHAVAYTASGDEPKQSVQYNTLTTAVGEQSPYPLILADGTKVWLNAMSSITFPVAFSGPERLVKITGEVYFEVAHRNQQTFKVSVQNQIVEDLGTHFNIRAYADEPVVKTTLLEGSIRVSANGQTLLLKPGQQVSGQRSGSLKISEADTEEAVSWKNGYFRFNDEGIESIMRQLARWYNIKVRYEGKTTGEGFYGRISRSKNISEVLQILEKTKGVHFKVEGGEVTVMQ